MAQLATWPELDTLERELRSRGFEENPELLAVAMRIAYERGFHHANHAACRTPRNRRGRGERPVPPGRPRGAGG